MRDYQRMKVYRAGWAWNETGHNETFDTFDDAERFVRDVIAEPKFREAYPHVKYFHMSRGRGQSASCGFVARREAAEMSVPDNAFGRSVGVLLHELAHAACPPMYERRASHGREYALTFIHLVGLAVGIEAGAALAKIMISKGVAFEGRDIDYMVDAAQRAAYRKSPFDRIAEKAAERDIRIRRTAGGDTGGYRYYIDIPADLKEPEHWLAMRDWGMDQFPPHVDSLQDLKDAMRQLYRFNGIFV